MKLYNTSTDTAIGDYPGTVDEALDAYARDSGWQSWRLWEIFTDAFGRDLADAVARSVGYESWAAWVAEGDAPRDVLSDGNGGLAPEPAVYVLRR